MIGFFLTLFTTWRLILLVSSAPSSKFSLATNESVSENSDWWLSQIPRQGIVAYGSPDHKVFRNVKDFGAKGDGLTDDTNAINSAITQGSRCGQGCDSSTVTPALVYFPPGIYIISSPLVQLYYTQFVGDAIKPPTIKASPNFVGIALIDSDPYADGGVNWYTNQNNFFRQVRNFVIDTTAMPVEHGSGIHWQVAQASSLQNIVFNMRSDGGEANGQQGIFMDNGSGGFMTDLTFNGGKFGAFLGNQQFTTRNLVFNNCQTAIYMNWNWAWTLSGISISNSKVGIDMANGGTTGQTVGSVLLVDSKISNTPIGITTAYSTTQGVTNGTLILDNVDFSENVPVAVMDVGNKATLVAGNSKVASWVQGHEYSASSQGGPVQHNPDPVTKPKNLLNNNGDIFARSKPQYENTPLASFKSVKSAGAKGDGVTDDTTVIQGLFNSVGPTDIVYFDHGAYVVTSTIKVPKNIKITGEIWPLIMAGGTKFSDASNPVPVFQVGQVGDVGSVEMSDLIFETIGPQPGAVLVEWNVAQESQGSAGMWDVHMRVGGTAGTKLQSDVCTKDPAGSNMNPACEGAFLLLHVTSQASIYLENNWFWVADHELDLPGFSQISLYSGRGVLIESAQGPVWLYGTSSEHNALYQYQISDASNVYMALIQTETPYYQSNPDATKPFSPVAAYKDPIFSGNAAENKSWGLRITHSSNIFVYGGGLYSFFENYSEECLTTSDCQTNMVSLESSSKIYLYGLSTKASTNMVSVNGAPAALDKDHKNNFCSTLAMFSG
ncbi:Glucan 1,3-beta-glucosidase [Podosphaera aphanis]|nr:Glucan 1,3-beta-glucosidase [Podosphaera aphanis]